MTNLDLITHAKLTAFKREVGKLLAETREYTLTAPDKQPATDHPDPTADVVLHPARVAVATAHRRVAAVYRALRIIEGASFALEDLETAVADWHGWEDD